MSVRRRLSGATTEPNPDKHHHLDLLGSTVFKPASNLIQQMDIAATLNESTALSVEEISAMVQAIWDSIATEQAYPDLTESQKHELDCRIESHDADPDNVITWEEMKASIRNPE